jgi:hypothetical protein
MSSLVYFDTSALVKWYLNEPFSEQVELFIQQEGSVAISTLTVVEVRCLLARRRRNGELTPSLEMKIFATFQEDLRKKYLIRHSVGDSHMEAAINLMVTLFDIPLRTLDAIHLAIAMELGLNILATSDRVMATASRALGLQTIFFQEV